MLMDFIANWGKWTWLILAGIFFVLELLAPGAFMLWLGFAALIVGIVTLFVIWPVSYQLIAFAVLALIALPIWRALARRVEKPVDQPFLNRRGDGFVGREFTLEKPIVAGTGTVRIDDSVWRLSGPDSAAGSRVKVVRADAATLVVEVI